jgi:hypothetical protein
VTIAPGVDWGAALGPGVELPRAVDDASLASLLSGGVGSTPVSAVATGGELWRFLGGESVKGRWSTNEARHYPVDLLRLELDDVVHWCVAAAVARRGRSRRSRPVAVVGNVGIWRRYRVLPRAHPDDGLADALWGELRWTELDQVRRRAVTGIHLPHPRLHERRATSLTIELGRRARWTVDGLEAGPAGTVRVTVMADAGVVVL